MTINRKNEADTITVIIDGWLDVETTPEFAEYMKRLEVSNKLVFDFAKLEYISSSGIREVVATYRKQKELGGSFEIINCNEGVMDVLKMTGLDKKFSIA